MCLAHLQQACARANSETLGKTYPTPHLTLQSRLRNLSWLETSGASSTDIFTVELGKVLVYVRCTAKRFAGP